MSTGNDDHRSRYDSDTHTYRMCFDWTSEARLSTLLIDTIAAVTNTPATEIGPLYKTVNPDAIEQLFGPTNASQRRHARGRLTFALNEQPVTVHSDGLIEVHLSAEE